MKQLLGFLFGLMCVLSCTHRPTTNEMDADKAKAIMNDISRRNKIPETLTAQDDTLLQQVIKYYQKSGTSNDLMEAYYLQGSVFRDLRDAPKALEAFLQGINAADTADGRCRYDILARLYGQKSELLYKQSSYAQSAENGIMAAKYAEKAIDTLYVLSELWQALGLHYSSGNYAAVADGTWSLLEKSKKWGYYQYAAGQLNTSILANLELGRVGEAQKLLTIYERQSGEVNLNTLECGFPIYYYTKGCMLLAQHRPQEAELFFRKDRLPIEV